LLVRVTFTCAYGLLILLLENIAAYHTPHVQLLGLSTTHD